MILSKLTRAERWFLSCNRAAARGNKYRRGHKGHCKCEWCWDGRERKRKMLKQLHDLERRQ